MLDTNDRILFPTASPAIEVDLCDCEMCGDLCDGEMRDGWGFPICKSCFDSIMMEKEAECEAIYGEQDAPDPMIVQESYAIEYDTDLSDDADDFRDVDHTMEAEW